jgi:hypothetical protein
MMTNRYPKTMIGAALDRIRVLDERIDAETGIMRRILRIEHQRKVIHLRMLLVQKARSLGLDVGA